jgi:hypothetical protein
MQSDMNDSEMVIQKSGSAYVPDIQSPKSGRLSREELMNMAYDLIRFLHTRTLGERFREQKGDKLRLAYARVELSAIQAYAALLKDEEIEELKKKITALEVVKSRSMIE